MRKGLMMVVMMVSAVLLMGAGCDQAEKFEQGSQKAAQYGAVVEGSIERAEPVVGALEDASGVTLPAGVSVKGQSVAEKVDAIATRVSEIGAVISAVPGPQQPVAGGVTAIAGALAGVAGALAGFFRKRQKKAEQGLRVVTGAIDDIEGIGAKVTKATVERGVADVVQAQYLRADEEA